MENLLYFWGILLSADFYLLRQYTYDVHVFFNQFLILILSIVCFLITQNALIPFSKVKYVSIPRLLNSVYSPK